jgi:hypothetical protein
VILLLALVPDYWVMPAEYLRDSAVALLLLDEDIEVFYGENRQRLRFRGLSDGGILLEESGWERGRRGLLPEYKRLELSEIDSVWVFVPLHDIKDRGPLESLLFAGGSAALGVPVGMAVMSGLFALAIMESPMNIGDAIALGYAAMYGGACLGGIGGCTVGSYLYEKKVARPPSQAKTQTLLDRIMELGEHGTR